MPRSQTQFPSTSWPRLVVAGCLLALAACNSVGPTASDSSEPSAHSDSAFTIEIEYFGEQLPTATQRKAFDRAAVRWSEVIIGDLADVVFQTAYQPCGSGMPFASGTVDDIRIFASVTEIDGPGEIVGRAGPCAVRSGNELPIVGFMEFDRADLQNLEAAGQLENVILHEMGHVLGIGTLWEYKSRALVDPPCLSGTPPDPRFSGIHATEAHEHAGGDGSPQVESDYGPGTRCGHWDEERYAGELMTGILGSGAAPLSAITIGSLHDLGYEVDYAAADPYTVPSLLDLTDHEPGFHLHEILITPDSVH